MRISTMGLVFIILIAGKSGFAVLPDRPGTPKPQWPTFSSLIPGWRTLLQMRALGSAPSSKTPDFVYQVGTLRVLQRNRAVFIKSTKRWSVGDASLESSQLIPLTSSNSGAYSAGEKTDEVFLLSQDRLLFALGEGIAFALPAPVNYDVAHGGRLAASLVRNRNRERHFLFFGSKSGLVVYVLAITDDGHVFESVPLPGAQTRVDDTALEIRGSLATTDLALLPWTPVDRLRATDFAKRSRYFDPTSSLRPNDRPGTATDDRDLFALLGLDTLPNGSGSLRETAQDGFFYEVHPTDGTVRLLVDEPGVGLVPAAHRSRCEGFVRATEDEQLSAE